MLDIKNKVIFIHIPKSGGKSIEKVICDFLKSERSELLMRKKNNLDPDYLPLRLAHMSYAQYQKYLISINENIRDYSIFTIVREESKRLESMYYHVGLNFNISFERFKDNFLSQIRNSNHLDKFFFESIDYYLGDVEKNKIKILYLDNENEIIDFLQSTYSIDIDALPKINKRKNRHNCLKKFYFKFFNYFSFKQFI